MSDQVEMRPHVAGVRGGGPALQDLERCEWDRGARLHWPITGLAVA